MDTLNTASDPHNNRGPAQKRAAAWLPHALACAAAVAVLLAVFTLYTRPAFLVTLADQIWACFQ
jgi:hypothetical protein